MDWSNVGVEAIVALTPVVVMVLLWALKLGLSLIHI